MLFGSLLIAGSAFLLQQGLGWLQTAESWTRDMRNHLTPVTVEAPAEVAVLYITETMLDRLEYRVPMDRAFLAELLAPLRQAGPAALGLDILFDHPTSNDPILRRALGAMPFPVVFAWIDESHGLRASQVDSLETFIGDGQRGLATFVVDHRDGSVRELPGPRRSGSILPMAALLAAHAGAEPVSLPRQLAYSPQLRGGAPWVRTYPLDYAGRILERNPDAFRGKILLVGLQSPLRDLHRAPSVSVGEPRARLPGVAIHAHAVAQLLAGQELLTTPPWVAFLIAMLFAMAGWIIGLLDIRLTVQISLTLLGGAVYVMATSATYASSQLLLPLVLPCLSLAAGLLISALAEGGQLRRQRSRVRKAFAQYVPRQVVDQLVDTPSSELLDGRRAVITCLFTDIAGFTRLSEGMDPVKLVELMNRYFDGITRIVHAHDGTVDKFIGDAVLAFFGAPLEQADHADRAIAAGIEIDRFCETLRQQLAHEGVPLGQTRVGIHTGEAVIGNVGGELRQNYTALGDAVNLASRLEGANRYLGSRVCASETTVGMATCHPCRPLARIVVKGRSQPIEVFEPLAVRAQEEKTVKLYHAAYEMLSEHIDHEVALRSFRSLHDAVPDDPVVALQIARLESGIDPLNLVLENK
jgi:class 3 adenylate cyclase